MKDYLLATIAIIGTVSGGVAFAGTIEDAVVEAPVYATAPVANTDWSGVYAGAQLGYGDIGVDNELDRDGDGDVDDDDDKFAFGSSLDGDGAIGGIHAGYLHDLGKYVVGAEIDYDVTGIDLGTTGIAELDSVTRLKLKAGYDAGRTLYYGVFGAAYADATVGGADLSDSGYIIGAGMSYLLTDDWMLGGEVLYHDFGNNFDGAGVSVDATTVQIRASYRF